MTLGLWNMEGYENNREFVVEMREKYNIDILCGCETWKHTDLNIYH